MVVEKPARGDDDKDPKDLGDNGKKALNAERQARRDAERKLQEATERVQALEDKDKSEGQKLTDRVTAAERERDEAKAELLRIQVGTAKGLTPAQSRRLVGTTKEELEADADELLDTFKPGDGKSNDRDDNRDRPARDTPRERLRGGSEPDEEPVVTDPRKLAESVPRQ